MRYSSMNDEEKKRFNIDCSVIQEKFVENKFIYLEFQNNFVPLSYRKRGSEIGEINVLIRGIPLLGQKCDTV